MSKAPYLVPKMRQGVRLGHAEMKDHMFLDGLEDAYDRDERGRGRLMGVYAEATAEAYQFTRPAGQRAGEPGGARTANEDGSFAAEIAPVEVNGRAGKTVIARDEQPFTADPAASHR